MSKTFSGKEAIKILCKYFGFEIKSQNGSHIKLLKIEGRKSIITIIPNHKELAHGTLKGALESSEVSFEDFMKFR